LCTYLGQASWTTLPHIPWRFWSIKDHEQHSYSWDKKQC